MEHIFDTIRAITAEASKLPANCDLNSLGASELASLVAELGRLRQETERALAWSAAEVNRRSRVEFGGAGLAKASGFANSEALIAVLTGTSRAEARKIDRLGRSLMHATDISTDSDVGEGPIAEPDAIGDAATGSPHHPTETPSRNPSHSGSGPQPTHSITPERDRAHERPHCATTTVPETNCRRGSEHVSDQQSGSDFPAEVFSAFLYAFSMSMPSTRRAGGAPDRE